jgi:hypothetical protein
MLEILEFSAYFKIISFCFLYSLPYHLFGLIVESESQILFVRRMNSILEVRYIAILFQYIPALVLAPTAVPVSRHNGKKTQATRSVMTP